MQHNNPLAVMFGTSIRSHRLLLAHDVLRYVQPCNDEAEDPKHHQEQCKRDGAIGDALLEAGRLPFIQLHRTEV